MPRPLSYKRALASSCHSEAAAHVALAQNQSAKTVMNCAQAGPFEDTNPHVMKTWPMALRLRLLDDRFCQYLSIRYMV